MSQDRTIVNLRRRLERAELKHLRQHAAELAERLERIESELATAREDADWLHDILYQMQEQAIEDGNELGLTVGGAIVCLGKRKAA